MRPDRGREASVESKNADEQRLLIGGEWVASSSSRTFERLDPYTGEIASVAAAAGRADARAAADAAGEAFPEWSQRPPAERRSLLHAAAELLRERTQSIVATVTAETGATFGWGTFNIGLATAMLED